MISINQYPTTDPKTGKIVVPPPIVLNGSIDIVFQDNLRWKTYYANITGFPVPILLWSGETYQAEAGEITANKAVAKLAEILGDDPSSYLQKLLPRTLEADPNGPGTILSGMISSLGIKITAGCSCKQRAIKMNAMGNEWCSNNLPEILGWLKEESTKRNLPFVEFVAAAMVKRAISKSQRLLKKEEALSQKT